MSLLFPGQQHLTVQTVQGGGLQLSGVTGSQGQTMQVEQTLALELPGQPGEKKRRMACTCPNCKDAEKRQVGAPLQLGAVVKEGSILTFYWASMLSLTAISFVMVLWYHERLYH